MLKGHPKGLAVLFISNLGERFGFCTMQAVLLMAALLKKLKAATT